MEIKNIMRNIFIILASLISYSLFSQAIFAKPSAQWKYNKQYEQLNDPSNDYTYNYTYFPKGDTTVVSGTWKKIFKIDSIVNNGDTTFYSYLRQDNNKIFQTNDLINSSLLYDFGVIGGDTICELSTIVDSVTNITINGQIRKKIYLTRYGFPNPYLLQFGCINPNMISLCSFIWIEGVGCVESNGYNGADLFEYKSSAPGAQPPSRYINTFICFADNLINYGSNDCIANITQGIKENKFNVSFFPNPFNDIIYVENLPINSTVNLYDITGKLIYSKFNTNEINTEALTKGVYVITINKGNYSYAQRLIK